MESRFNDTFFSGCVSLSGDMSCVGVDRSRTITIFCCSIRPTAVLLLNEPVC